MPDIHMTPTRIWGSMSATLALGNFESHKFEVGEEWTAAEAETLPHPDSDEARHIRALFADTLKQRIRRQAGDVIAELEKITHGDSPSGQLAIHYGLGSAGLGF